MPPNKLLSNRTDLIRHMVRVLGLGLVVGASASLLAIAFIEAVAFLSQHLFLSTAAWSAHLLATGGSPHLKWLPVLILPFAGLVVGLLLHYGKQTRPQGLSDVILAVQSKLQYSQLTLKDGIINYIAALVSLGAGASLGQYGPIVHLGATLGNYLNRWAKTEVNIVIGCGVAAGISTAFNAPIAGVLFAHEVILRHYSLRAFAPITVAASVGYYLSNYLFNYPPLFSLGAFAVQFASEFFMFILVGIGGALVAVGFMQAIVLAQQQVAKLGLPMVLKPLLAGCALSLFALQVPEVLGIGEDLLQNVVRDADYSIAALSGLLLAKIAATVLCVSLGFVGGVFSPALLCGVLFGALFGGVVDLLMVEHSAIGVYALAGMAAVTSPIIGAPLSSILVVFELTRSYELTTAVMVSVAFSNLVAYRLFCRSLFDYQLKARGYDLSSGHDQLMLGLTPICTLSRAATTQLSDAATLYQARQLLSRNNNTMAYISDAQNRYLGAVDLNHILNLEASIDLKTALAKDYLLTGGLTLDSNLSLWEAMNAVGDFVGESLPVVDSDSGTLQGVITAADLISAYMRYMQDERAEQHAGV